MLTKNIPYTFNRGGYFYFSRRVPSDLLHHYSYPRIVQGLRTKSQQTAKTRALVAAAKLDERWSAVRRRMIWNSRADLVADGLGSSGLCYAA